MARKSLRPQLNQIRAWVRQGRTDAWVAHQLEVTVQEIEQFKRQNELAGDEEAPAGATTEFPEEIDLRAEDDALIAAELEAAALEAERERAEAEEAERLRAEEAERERAERAERGEAEDGDDEEDESPRPRRRGRRGGRTRRSAPRSTAPLEGTFDHGEEGYGLWLDPAVQDNPIYAEHWAGHRPVEVVVEEDQIVIRRTGSDD
jgi:hypothetical protein